MTTLITITRMDDAWLAPLLQASDSAFPTGGYAHSAGFEQMVARGVVRDAPSLVRYLDDHVWPALIRFELPVVRLAHAADRGRLLALDEIVEAAKGARELREASRALGQRRLHSMRGIGVTLPEDYAALVESGKTAGHHAVVFGAAFASIPLQAVLTAWCFQGLNSICLAAPKLLRIGQDAVQRVLAGALRDAGAKIRLSREVDLDDLGWFDPALEIASMQHETAHERLFIS
jgi:urease accessory protein